MHVVSPGSEVYVEPVRVDSMRPDALRARNGCRVAGRILQSGAGICHMPHNILNGNDNFAKKMDQKKFRRLRRATLR